MNDPQDARWRAFVVEMLTLLADNHPTIRLTNKQLKTYQDLTEYYTSIADGKEGKVE